MERICAPAEHIFGFVQRFIGAGSQIRSFLTFAKKMRKKPDDPLPGPFGALLKFVGAAFFGCLISLVLFIAAFWIDDEVFWGGWWHHLLWVIPVVWGLLGIFWFEPMLKAGKAVFDAAFNIDE